MKHFRVANNNMLGMIDDRCPFQFQILATSITRGSTWSWLDGVLFYIPDNLRPATREDFDTFMVSFSKHWENPDEYEPLAPLNASAQEPYINHEVRHPSTH